ncbi:MAG TPA: helix-turn-helix domain-containing protein [Candidatus Acidoferrales bacterium]|jgi:excisionase family DNA binding protein|nr:helix-turn-helix domain-containing protein [Candidatus Acidoferrales bacterium]
MEKFLYDKRTAAQMLSISVRLLEYLFERGELRRTRVGGRVLVHHKELERLASRGVIENLVPQVKPKKPILEAPVNGEKQTAEQSRSGSPRGDS